MLSLHGTRPASSAMMRVTITAAMLLVLPGICPFGVLRAPAAVGQTEPAAPAAAGNQGEPVTGAVIPPGQEELLAQMLGRGATLPGPCSFANGEVEHTIVRASYTCPQGEVVFDLVHPSTAPSGATRTERFAVTLHSGSPPNGLADALVSLIRSHEATFQWKWIEPPTKRLPPTRTVLLCVAALVVIAGVWLLLRRRRRPATIS